MRRMIRHGVEALALVAVLACGRTRTNHDEPRTDASRATSASSTTRGTGLGGTVATDSDTGSSSDTAGSSGGVLGTGGAGVTGGESSGSGRTDASGGNSSGSTGSAGAAGEPGTGGSSGSPDPSCHAFVRVFEEESCLACRTRADATCEIYFRQTEMTCPGSSACFMRHCALGCNDDCEADSCACLESCVPTGPSDCQNAFDELMGCYAGLCGDC